MKIKSLMVERLNGNTDFTLALQPDLNLLTGKNGSGKTTLLKLLWYLISANAERVLPEIHFRSLRLETDSFTLMTDLEAQDGPDAYYKWTFISGKDKTEVSKVLQKEDTTEINWINRAIIRHSEGSIFFPTFRRIEGGFSMTNDPIQTGEKMRYLLSTGGSQVPEAITQLSERLSVGNNIFVASISTRDIVDLLTKRYAAVSERINTDNLRVAKRITDTIQQYSAESEKNQSANPEGATTTLSRIEQLVRSNTNRQEKLLKPFSALRELITKILQHKGIEITKEITIGESNEAIKSDVLSAGEKQMLSFLAYNALARDSVVFIDEPEISLHVDWQRILFPTLLSQETNNQFIVATHSPFIYSKYADKEINLNPDRGE